MEVFPEQPNVSALISARRNVLHTEALFAIFNGIRNKKKSELSWISNASLPFLFPSQTRCPGRLHPPVPVHVSFLLQRRAAAAVYYGEIPLCRKVAQRNDDVMQSNAVGPRKTTS